MKIDTVLWVHHHHIRNYPNPFLLSTTPLYSLTLCLQKRRLSDIVLVCLIPVVQDPTTDGFFFTGDPNDVQGGGVNADAKAGGRGAGSTLLPSLSLVLVLTSLISYWI